MSTSAPTGIGARLFIKRAADVGVSLLLLAVGLPLIGLLALLVKASSPGPVLFVQERVGKGERIFRMYKFRTMTVRPGSTQSMAWSKADEEAVTRVGRVLRDFGLDELPQLVNIVRGEMSIIGPRPPIAEQLGLLSSEERRMFRMRPGVLSLAAIKGRRSLTMEERYRLHVEYVDNWSLASDLRILIKAAWVVLGRKNAEERR